MSELTSFIAYKGVIITDKGQLRRQISIVPFNDGLEYLQGLVGGHLEHFIIDDVLDSIHIDMWIDEEGKFKEGLQPTIALTHEGKLVDVIIGNCVFSKYNDEGETYGLTSDEVILVIDWIQSQDIVGLVPADGTDLVPVISVSR